MTHGAEDQGVHPPRSPRLSPEVRKKRAEFAAKKREREVLLLVVEALETISDKSRLRVISAVEAWFR